MRILFITANRLGDAILSTGLLDELHRQRPKARFTVVCGPAAAGVFTAAPNLERLIVMRKKPWARHWWDLWKQVAATRWSLVVDLRGSGIGQFLMAHRRRGYSGPGPPMHTVIGPSNVLQPTTPSHPRVWNNPAPAEPAARRGPSAGEGKDGEA